MPTLNKPAQRLFWIEPLAFARARASGAACGAGKLPFALLVFGLLAMTLVMVAPPKNAEQVGQIALIAAACALFIVFLVVPLASRLPEMVVVTSDRVVIGQEVIPLRQIEYAVVGTTKMGNETFPVLTFRTKGGEVRILGLGRKVIARDLATFLIRAGVREP